MPICKLCDTDQKLIDAHIIPRRFWEYSGNEGKPLAVLGSRPGLFPKRSQIGEYDNEILCKTCDQKLGVFDQHATEYLLKETGQTIPGIPTHFGRQYPKVDAATIHRFIASVAWRASVSKRDYFARVQLGPYEELALKSIQAPEPHFTTLAAFISEFNVDEVPFLNPQYSVMDSIKFLVIFASRFTFYLKVDKRPLPDYFETFRIDPSRPVRTVIRNWEGSKQFEAMRQLVHSNPKPSFW